MLPYFSKSFPFKSSVCYGYSHVYIIIAIYHIIKFKNTAIYHVIKFKNTGSIGAHNSQIPRVVARNSKIVGLPFHRLLYSM